MYRKEETHPAYTYARIATDAAVISHMQRLGGIIISNPKEKVGFSERKNK